LANVGRIAQLTKSAFIFVAMKKLVLYTFMIAVISACASEQTKNPESNQAKSDTTNTNSGVNTGAVTQTPQSSVPSGSVNSGSANSKPGKPVFEYAGKVKEILFFSPTYEELVAITANENDDTQRIQIENFETNANKFIEATPFEGYNYRFYEMSEIVLPLRDGKMFRLVRDTPDLLCGVLFYDGVKEPKVLRGDLKAADYQREAKNYFK
jgi:hypothetical protein